MRLGFQSFCSREPAHPSDTNPDLLLWHYNTTAVVGKMTAVFSIAAKKVTRLAHFSGNPLKRA
jgi:hypothetical protein